MSTDLKRREKFTSRLESVGVLHQDAAELSALTLKWVECSGEEWTVKRFKALKLEFITSVVSLDCTIVRAPWMKRGKDGYPSGILRRFWVDSYYKKRPQTVINAFQIYSSFVSPSATETQVKKFVNSASSPIVALPLKISNFVKKFPWRGIEDICVLESKPYWSVYRSPIKRVPALKGTAPEDDISSDLSFSSNSMPVREMYEFYPQMMNLSMNESLLDAWKVKAPLHEFVGTISYIQEPGYKLRAVANPTRVVQHALAPLKELLGDIIRMFPEDCTHDQDSGVLWCQNHLQNGTRLHSIDLSDATNLFPFELQMAVLKAIGRFLPSRDRPNYLELMGIFSLASKSKWRLPDGTPLTFVKGQPLGLGPSFFLFALSHHMILRSLAGAGKYVILGDDVVICDDNLSVQYRMLMSQLGCKISEEKSIASQHLAEFASRLIRPNDVIRQWKWREITRSNVIDICRNMGPNFASQVPRTMKHVIDALSPIPIELGGLGWNTKGVSLSSRIDTSVAEEIIFSVKEEVVVFRQWKSCAISDFLKALIHFRGSKPDVGFVHPLLDKDPLISHEITYSMLEDDDPVKPLFLDQLRKIRRLSRPGPILGETVIYPMKAKAPVGYIIWGPPNNPWQTDRTAGLYRVVSRILKGERSVTS